MIGHISDIRRKRLKNRWQTGRLLTYSWFEGDRPVCHLFSSPVFWRQYNKSGKSGIFAPQGKITGLEMTGRGVGKVLCLVAGTAYALLHVATFLTVVPGLLILVPFFLLMGAILCTRAIQGWDLPYRDRVRLSMPKGKTAVVGYVLLVYAVLLFVHFYKSSGGASSVGIVEGQYVYMYKSAVIRPISEEEYKMFPTQVARIMSAWLGMGSTFCLASLINSTKTGAQET
jgi:hypothetical protein